MWLRRGNMLVHGIRLFVKRQSPARVALSIPIIAATMALQDGEDTLLSYLKSLSGSFSRFSRSIYVGVQISLLYKLRLLNLAEDSEEYLDILPKCHQIAADMIFDACLSNGGLYIKMGQGLATLNHVLPDQYIKTLEILNNKALTRTSNEVERIFLADFGSRPEDLFEEFDYVPFAAASLAQVHRAVTKTGEKVAVKVQYADLRPRFHTDIATLELLLQLVQIIHPNFGFAWILRDLKKTLAEELDFEHEADNADRCRKDLRAMGAHRKNGSVYVPRVLRTLSSKRVLTAEYIDGFNINETEALIGAGFSLARIDRILVETFGRQLFCSGFVHADPHPGNLLVRPRPAWSEPANSWSRRLWAAFRALLHLGRSEVAAQLVILDHGLYESLPDRQRRHLCNIYKSVIDNDEMGVQSASADLGVTDWATFGEVIIQRPWRRKGIFLPSKLTESDREYIRCQAQFHFDRVMSVLREMPPSMLLFIRNLNLVRSICRNHGDPINRHQCMIYTALLGLHCSNHSNDFSSCLSLSRVWSEWQFYTLQIKAEMMQEWLIGVFYRVLYHFGMAPDMREIIKLLPHTPLNPL